MEGYRKPIISVLGHVDSGKTSLLDALRGTVIHSKEAGGITQSIGATEIPADTLRGLSGDLLSTFHIELKVPGLLFIDTPGHAAFVSLRKRGGSLADLAVLVVDITKGIQEQTIEAIEILKHEKTPFIIALSKLDRLQGWKSSSDSFFSNQKRQHPSIQEELQNRIYDIMGAFSHHCLSVDLYTNIKEFTKTVSIIPLSSKTGEGIPDLLMMITGLAQQFLGDQIRISSEIGRGSVLEVCETKGLGVTLDVILYDGVFRERDIIVTATSTGTLVTPLRRLLRPRPLMELVHEKKFERVRAVSAAAGVKLCVSDADKVITGAPIVSVPSADMVPEAERIVLEELSSLALSVEPTGIIVKANSLGSLEAVLHLCTQHNISVSRAELGCVRKEDVIESDSKDSNLRAIFAFSVSVNRNAEEAIKESQVRLFSSQVIYELVESYLAWKEEMVRELETRRLSEVSKPAHLLFLPKHTFRASKPAVIGVEILSGTLTVGSVLMTPQGVRIGVVRSIQDNRESVSSVNKGKQVALSVDGPVVGRTISESDMFYTRITKSDYEFLEEVKKKLRGDELETLDRILEIQDAVNIRWRLGASVI